MATSRKSQVKRVRARRSLLASRPRLPRLNFEPHQVDVLGLGLIAIGIFLSCVAYLRWAGGTVGEGGVHGLRFVFGALGYAVPAAIKEHIDPASVIPSSRICPFFASL